MISIDSLGWLERLLDGPKAARYNRVIDATPPQEIVTSPVTVYEVYRKVKPVRGEAPALEAVGFLQATKVVPVEAQLALEAADFSLAHGLHFADSLIYATARRFHAPLHTSDPDLRELAGVVFH